MKLKLSCLRLVNTVSIFTKFLRTQSHGHQNKGSIFTVLLLYYIFIGCPQNSRDYKGVQSKDSQAFSQDFPCSVTTKVLLLTHLGT